MINRLLRKMSWKTRSGKWMLDEIKFDLIAITIGCILIAGVVYYGKG